MTPFYADELITLFHCRCEDFMAECADKQYQIAITDPPYSELCNLHEGSSSDMEHGWGKNWASNKHFKWNKRPDSKYFNELQRISDNQIIWGGNYFLNDLQDTSCVIIWNKGQRNFSLADGEMAWTSFDKPLRIFDYSRAENNKTERIHINQKPVALYRWLLQNYAKPGWEIVDTHLGSGSIAIACHDLGFKLVATECDLDYLTAAVNRIKNYLKQPKWFKPSAPVAEQTKLF